MSFLPDDDEPEPPSLIRRLLVGGALAVAAAAVAVLIVRWPFGALSQSSASRSRASTAAPGRLIAHDFSAHRIVSERPDGSDRRPTGAPAVEDFPLVSPDGREIVTSHGLDLFAVVGTRLVQRRPPAIPIDGTGGKLLPQSPFADHDRLLVEPRALSSDTAVSLIDGVSGRTYGLGMADDVSGDPGAAGVYAGVPVGAPRVDQPDSRMERRLVGHRAAVVITAKAVARLAGWSATTRMHLTSFPAPDGHAVAVVAVPLRGNTAALVVLTPDGHVVDHVRGADINAAYWSPDSQYLAYVVGADVSELVTWSPGAVAVRRARIPRGALDWFGCVWSADDGWIACAGALPDDPISQRLLLRPATGHLDLVSSANLPLLWPAGPAAR